MRANWRGRATAWRRILLLDEIAAHLDVMRRAALFEEIHALGAQAWMTGTDLSLFDGARAQIFEVRDGAFHPQGGRMIPLHNYLLYMRPLCRGGRDAGPRRHRHRGARPGLGLSRHHSRRPAASWWAI